MGNNVLGLKEIELGPKSQPKPVSDFGPLSNHAVGNYASRKTWLPSAYSSGVPGVPLSSLETASHVATWAKRDCPHFTDVNTEDERLTGRAASWHNSWCPGNSPGAGQCSAVGQ